MSSSATAQKVSTHPVRNAFPPLQQLQGRIRFQLAKDGSNFWPDQKCRLMEVSSPWMPSIGRFLPCSRSTLSDDHGARRRVGLSVSPCRLRLGELERADDPRLQGGRRRRAARPDLPGARLRHHALGEPRDPAGFRGRRRAGARGWRRPNASSATRLPAVHRHRGHLTATRSLRTTSCPRSQACNAWNSTLVMKHVVNDRPLADLTSDQGTWSRPILTQAGSGGHSDTGAGHRPAGDAERLRGHAVGGMSRSGCWSLYGAPPGFVAARPSRHR